MGTRHRSKARRGTILAGLLAGAGLLISPFASADPVPPDPAPTDPAPSSPSLPSPPSVFGFLGLPDLPPAFGPNLILGQNLVPSAPGDAVPIAAPDLSAFNDQYLLAQNTRPAAPGEGIDAPGLDQLEPTSGRLDYLGRLYGMYQSGDLKGALLGQMPKDQLGEPLPGTAPGPGINIPPGLGQDLPQPLPPAAPGN